MKWGRFLFGVAAGATISYLVFKEMQEKPLKPEQVIQQLKDRYQTKMSIVGSWIHVQPQKEEIDGIEYTVYQCGLTGLTESEPRFFEFRVDADTGTVLSVNGSEAADRP